MRTSRAIAPEDLLLYAVTDGRGRSLEHSIGQITACLEGGATCLQLRSKEATTDQLIVWGRAIAPVCRRFEVPLIIDDDIEAALTVGAGLHIGQQDMDARQARKMLGPDAVLGVSAQTVPQALAAQEAGADYLGVGALVPTPTKPDAVDVSAETLRAICDAVDIPVVGIGGLNADTIGALKGSGCAGAAVVSAIFAQDDIEAATRDLLSLCARTFK